MTLRRFRHDLRRGLGSAPLTLRSSADPAQYVDAVRWACLHVTTYDYQCEGGRGWYLHKAACLTGQPETIEAEIIGKFAVCPPDGWRFDYLEDILLQFALDGSASSRQSLWDNYDRLMARYARTVRRDGWWTSMSTLESLTLDLVSLDGWSAACTAMSSFGDALASGPSEPEHARWTYFPEWFDSDIREQFGDTKVDAYLADHPSSGLHVYAETFETCRTRPRNTGERAPKPTIETLAALVDTDQDILREGVQSTLGQQPADWKRAHALDLLSRREHVNDAINLIQASYQAEDEPVVGAAIRGLSLRDASWHAANWDAIDLLTPEDRPVTTDVLRYIYRQNLCSNCRERAVRLMYDKHVLPEEIVQECHWDANSSIRDFVAQITSKD